MKKGILIIITLMTFVSIMVGYSYGGKASTGVSEVSEEVLLKKDTLVDTLCIFNKDVNPYFASTKTVVLTNQDEATLSKLNKKGFKFIITGEESNNNLPVPVKIKGKNIVVSINSSDEAMIDSINKVLS